MRIIFSLIAASVLLLSATSAIARQVCVPHGKAVMELKKQFEESVSGRGPAANGKRMIELFVSEKGSWTVLISDPNGRSGVIDKTLTGEDQDHRLAIVVKFPNLNKITAQMRTNPSSLCARRVRT